MTEERYRRGGQWIRLGRTNSTTPSSDSIAPSVPTNLRTTNINQTSVSLAWDASTDDVGVVGYEIRQGTVILSSTETGLEYTVAGLMADTIYQFDVRARDAAGNWSERTSALAVTTAAATPPGQTTNLDDLIEQPGGQTILLPAGTYSVNDVVGARHDEWLILAAEIPGTVVVDSGFKIDDSSKIMFAGIDFRGQINVDNVGAIANGERIVFWYCKMRPTNGLINSTQPNGIISRANYTHILGCDIRECAHDGVKYFGNDSSMQGTRIWSVTDSQVTNDFHNDALQAQNGVRNLISFCSLGINDSGATQGQGHLQFQSDLGPLEYEVSDTWIAGSGNFALTADGKTAGHSCQIVARDLYCFDNNFGTVNSARGATVAQTNVIDGPPPNGTTPPDEIWRTANPYESYELWLQGQGI